MLLNLKYWKTMDYWNNEQGFGTVKIVTAARNRNVCKLRVL